MKVTDEMVDRAVAAFASGGGFEPSAFDAVAWRSQMRIAIEAALRAQPSEPQGVLTENERRRAIANKISQVGWKCVTRQQSLPEPADCDWPMCGCDPYADKVIEALQESGVISDMSAPAGNAGGDAEKGHNDPSWSLFDRVDFALRDAGFDLDEASDIATMAAAMDASCDLYGPLTGEQEAGMRAYCMTHLRAVEDDYPATGEFIREWLTYVEKERNRLFSALLRKLQQGADYVMVPRVPTPKMVDATFNEDLDEVESESHNERNRRIYAAMIAASQGQEGGK